MKKVLIVEDSPIVAKVLLHLARHVLAGYNVQLATTLSEAKSICDASEEDFFAAIVDLNLPDAPDGEIVDYTLEKKIPTIVLTGSFDDERRDKLFNKGIVDYVSKDGKYSYQYAVKMIRRLEKNQNVKVLVAEDSKTMRKYIVKLLKVHQYQTFEAEDGVDAIKVFLANPDIRLVITDYNMPNMDGFELVKNFRHKYEKLDLLIIGLSAEGESNLSAKLIKSGANDFLTKPFNHEEFYCRINHSVESLDLVEQIRDSANRDYLTEVYSRRYFFEKSEEPYNKAKEKQSPMALGIISIDDMRAINDEHSHVVGDTVLITVAKKLEGLLSKFLFARSAGKEFYVLMPGLPNDKAFSYLDKVRSLIASEAIMVGNKEIYVSFSAGVSNQLGERINDQITIAEHNLIRAKEAGKNIVIGDDEDG